MAKFTQAALTSIALLFLVHDTSAQTETTPEALNYLRAYLDDQAQYTDSLQFDEYRSAGVLEGCGVSFNVALHDWAAFPQGITYAIGSIVYLAKEDSVPFLLTKLAVADFTESNGEVEVAPGEVNYTYLTNAEESLAGEESGSIESDRDSSLLTRYDELDLRIGTFMLKGPIDFNFNRAEGGSDVSFTVDTTDPSVKGDLLLCMATLVTDLLEREGLMGQFNPNLNAKKNK